MIKLWIYTSFCHMFGAAANGVISGAKHEMGIDNIFRVKFHASSVMEKSSFRRTLGSQLCHYSEVLSKRSWRSWCHRENQLHQGWRNRAKCWPIPAFPRREQHLPGGKEEPKPGPALRCPFVRTSGCTCSPAKFSFPRLISGSEDPTCPSDERFSRAPMELRGGSEGRWMRRAEPSAGQHRGLGCCCEAPAPLAPWASSLGEEKVVQLILPDSHRLSRVMQKYLTSTWNYRRKVNLIYHLKTRVFCTQLSVGNKALWA